MAIHGNISQYMTIDANTWLWLDMARHGYTWQYTAIHGKHGNTWPIHGNTWQYMGNKWLYMAIHCNTWQYVVINGYTRHYMAVHGNT